MQALEICVTGFSKSLLTISHFFIKITALESIPGPENWECSGNCTQNWVILRQDDEESYVIFSPFPSSFLLCVIAAVFRYSYLPVLQNKTKKS